MKLDKARYHIAAWSIYIGYELALLRLYKPIAHPGYVLLLYLLEILLFYANFYCYKKYNAAKGRIYRLLMQAGISLILFCFFSFLKWNMGLHFGYINYSRSSSAQLHSYMAGIIFRTALTIGESIGYWIIYCSWQKERVLHHLELETEKANQLKLKMEQQLVRAQNAWLRSRINPHLLYNTLNFFYSKFEKDTANRRGIELLVKIMRFSMGHPGPEELVKVSEEWEQVENYIALQRIRFEKDHYMSYLFINQYPEAKLPPVILLTLVENIYKHGNLTDPAAPASIRLITTANNLQFIIHNMKRKAHHAIADEHIGMGNVRTRLEYVYGPGGYRLETGEDKEASFSLKLQIFYKHENK